MSHSCLVPVPRDGRWMRTHEKYVETVTEEKCDVIFIGDSIIQNLQTSCLWHDVQTVFPGALNLGIGGDRVENVLWRIQNGEISWTHQFKAVVLLVGTNNVDCEPDEIFEGICEIVKEIKNKLKDVIIILPTLLPKGQYPNPYREKNDDVNKLLFEKFEEEEMTEETQNVFVVQIGDNLLEKDDSISNFHLYDYLHLTDIGYLKTFSLVLDKLIQLLLNK